MMKPMNADENGWVSSSQAWIDRMPEAGDFSREFVLDKPMVARAIAANPSNMLDIGCGDGRFCRMLKAHGVARTGVDPVEHFVDYAAERDPDGYYVAGFAESLPFADQSFDLVVFYLSLIDIDDLTGAVAEAARVLRPGGHILIGNLASFFTSNGNIDWIKGQDGQDYYPFGPAYHIEQKEWYEWDGLRVRNWHRPLSTYMQIFLSHGLKLTQFDEPLPQGCTDEQLEWYKSMPYLMMMEWQKPSLG